MANQFLLDLYSTAESRYNRDSSDMTHGDWICANTSLNKRPFSFDRYPFQKQIADDMHPNLDCIKPSQVGLALALDTPIMTPNGWSTMGEIKEGDQVFDENGQPCKVTYVSPIYEDHECFELEFDTGETIVADANHRWYVESDKAFDERGIYQGRGRPPEGVQRKGIINTKLLSTCYQQKGRNCFAIPNTKPLKYPESPDLLIDPYILGSWLGDGNSASATITVHKPDRENLFQQIKYAGYEYSISSQRGNTYQYRLLVPRDLDLCQRGHKKSEVGTVGEWSACKKCHHQNIGREDREESIPYDTFYKRLSDLNLIKNKHIPEQYLQASYRDRLSLLQGLMDTDGSITKRGRASFYNTNTKIIEQVSQLIHSLGFKSRTRWKKPARGILQNGHVIQGKNFIAEVSFVAYSDTPVFRLQRKNERLLSRESGRSSETSRRRIVKVSPVPSVPVRCISVDSESHLYLAGKGLIPTHNTEIQIRKALAILSRTPNTSLIYTMPSDRMFKRISKARIQPLLSYDKAFRQESGQKTKDSMDLMRIGSSFLYVTGSAEADATSINADFVFNDEVDLTDSAMLSLFNSRLQGSDYRVSQRFSTPTYEGFGVDKGYARSDQHEYVIKCKCCNHWQVPLFNRSFIRVDGLPDDLENLEDLSDELVDSGKVKLETARVVCEKCEAPLNLADYENREWVATYPSRVLNRGYRVRTFSTHRLDPAYCFTQLFKYKERDNMKGFFNTVKGEPYTNEDQKLTLSQIETAMGKSAVPEPNAIENHFIGIDMGATCHITVGAGVSPEKMRTVLCTTCKANEIQGLVKRLDEKYRFVMGAIDRYPYTPTADAICKASGGRIVPVHYAANREVEEKKDGLGLVTHINVNRTQMLDYVANGVKGGNWVIEGYTNHRTAISEHLQDMVREEVDEKQPVWVKLNGRDHFFHAMGYLAAAVVYKRLRDGLADWVNLDDSISGGYEGNRIFLGDEPNDIFGTSDLIGYSQGNQRNIIRRHTTR